jgi:hypothetical protein
VFHGLITRTAAAAALALVLTAAEAGAAVSVGSFSVTPSTTQAGASPSVTQEIRFSAGAGDTIKDLTLALPAGLLANPTVGPPCAAADLDTGTCPAGSRLDDGTSTVSVTAFGIPANAEAQLYLVAPQPGELARIGLVTAFGGVRVVSQGPVIARTGTDAGIDVAFRDFPSTVPGTSEPLTVDGVRITLPGAVNDSPFTRNPTACGPATTRLSGVSHAGSAFGAESAYTPTGCDALPFAPNLAAAATLGPGTDGVAVETVVAQAAGEAAVESAKLTLPPGLAPRLTVVARACSLPDPAACPESATVGSGSVATPLQAAPLEGRVVLVAGSPLPGLAIVLPPPFPLRLAGTTALGAGGVTATFAGIPDVPISRLTVSFAGGPASLFTGSRALCSRPLDARAELGAHSGRAAQAVARLAVAGCATGATRSARPTGTLSLRGLGGRNPVLALIVRAPADGTLRSAIVRLPRGVAVRNRGLSRSLRVTAGGRVVRGAGRVVDGRLHVRLRGGGTRTLGIALKRPALRISRRLASRVRGGRARWLSARVTVGASGRSPVTLTVRATPRR